MVVKDANFEGSNLREYFAYGNKILKVASHTLENDYVKI